MKITYTHEDEQGREIKTFDSLSDFLTFRPFFRELLSQGREEHLTYISIEVPDLPCSIKVEIDPGNIIEL